MSSLIELKKKLNAETGKAYGLIRIFLGVALAVRGWMILSNPESLLELGVERESFIWVSLIGFYASDRWGFSRSRFSHPNRGACSNTYFVQCDFFCV